MQSCGCRVRLGSCVPVLVFKNPSYCTITRYTQRRQSGHAQYLPGSQGFRFSQRLSIGPAMSFLLHQSRFFTTVDHLRDLPPHAAARNRIRGTLERGKIDGHQYSVQPEAARVRQQDAGTHAAYQLLLGRAGRPRRPAISSISRVTVTPKCRARRRNTGSVCCRLICKVARNCAA